MGGKVKFRSRHRGLERGCEISRGNRQFPRARVRHGGGRRDVLARQSTVFVAFFFFFWCFSASDKAIYFLIHHHNVSLFTKY